MTHIFTRLNRSFLISGLVDINAHEQQVDGTMISEFMDVCRDTLESISSLSTFEIMEICDEKYRNSEFAKNTFDKIYKHQLKK